VAAGDGTSEALASPPRPNLHRVCTECGKQLLTTNPRAKTCSQKCRNRRSRRLAAERRAQELAERQINPAVDGVGTAAVAKADGDLLARVMQEELRPVVRENITQDTLRAIQRLVALTPLMVEAMGRDLQHPDPQIRQRAYTVGMRYTLGHSAIVTPPEEASRQTMTVIFDGMVRPGQEPAPELEAPPVDTAPRICNSCDETKPADQFVEHSDRCKTCHDELHARMSAVLGQEETVE